MNVSDLVVGTPECPINIVASILRIDAHLMDHWSSLTMGLGISSVGIKTLQNDLRLDKITYSDLIHEVLGQWVGTKGSNAKLIVLMLVLEGDCKAVEAIQCLARHFNLSYSFYNLITWKDLTVSLEAKVVRNLHKLFPSLCIDLVTHILTGMTLLHLTRDNFPETLPECPSYYVQRRMRTRSIISTKIFEENDSDIFLIGGIARHELTRLAKDKITDHSTNQLKQRSITVRHMILDSPTHFDKICKLVDEKQHVHWFRFDDKKLRWIRSSSGGIPKIQDCMDQEQIDMDEGDFYEQLDPNTNSPVCISDGPGMGKSMFLAQIGRRLKAQFPDRTVIFLVLNETVKRVRENDIEKLLQSLVKSENTNSGPVTIELLLDGLDEVDPTDLEFVFGLLRQINTSMKSIRLWVTTRVHLLNKLEVNLNTIGFHINPFSVEDQTKFLTSYWLNNINSSGNVVMDQLSKFAHHCLTTLKSIMKSKVTDIAGIPLQCLLIAEVYAEEAEAYGTADSSALPLLHISSVTEMYEALITRKFKKRMTTETGALMDMHVALSLRLIFPEMFPKLQHLFIPTDTAEILRVGVMEAFSQGADPRFIHRTFAEYFVAWWVVHRLIPCEDGGDALPDFFINHILQFSKRNVAPTVYQLLPPDYDPERTKASFDLYEFTYSVITHFLNSIIANVPPFPEPQVSSFASYPKFAKDAIIQIALSCAAADYPQLFRFLMENNAFRKHEEDIFGDEFLHYTFMFSGLTFVKLGLEQYEKFHKFNMHIQERAMHLTCTRGEYSILEFLINEKQLRWMLEKTEGNTFLFDCVENSRDDSQLTVDNKTQVIRLLLEINPYLLESKKKYEGTPLLSDNVHIRLMIELISLGANVLERDNDNQTVIHIGYENRSFRCSDYDQLLKSISLDNLRQLVTVRDSLFDVTPLELLLLHSGNQNPTPETLELFKLAGADFNYAMKNGKGKSILAIAVVSGASGDTIRHLIQLGANPHWRKA